MKNQKNLIDRRDLLKLGVAGLGTGVATRPSVVSEKKLKPQETIVDLGSAPEHLFSSEPIEIVRIGFVGVGLQGGAHVRNFLKIDGVKVVAIADINKARAEEVAGWITSENRESPTLYTNGENDFMRMCSEEDLDLVFTATPWKWHVPVCLAAMENDKHAATEVPAAYTVEDCWKLVEWAEKYEKHCVMMENCNYDRPEMMVFNLARKGLLRRLMHTNR